MLPQLRIGNLSARLPIIQGGMAVRVSTARLAAAVANEGGAGIIAGTGLSLGALQEEIRKARKLTSGLIGVNVLFAATQFANLVKTAMKEKVDFIVAGAGFSRDIFSWGKDHSVPVFSMVSSGRLAKLAEKMGAAAVIAEGKEAGGHLGTDKSLTDLLSEVINAVKIPVIAAGGIINGFDIARVLKLGASGVQMATRFVASDECEVHQNFKDKYLTSPPQDSVLIQSPVGLPGRAIRNSFTERLKMENIHIKKCIGCLKTCLKTFCILDALEKAVEGDMENGLVFSGEFYHRIDKIQPVKDIISQLICEYDSATM